MMPRRPEAPKSAGPGHTASMQVRRLVVGGALVGLGVLVGVVGLVWALRGLFTIEATVPADGEPHRVELSDGQHFLWVDASVTAPACEVEADGTTVPLRRVGGTFTRSYGSAGPWEARWWFDAPGGVVTLTCEGVTRSAREAVEIGPRIEGLGLVGRLLGTVGLAALLVLAGGLLLLVTIVRGIASRSAPPTPPVPRA